MSVFQHFFLIYFFSIFLFINLKLPASPISEKQAEQLILNWLKQSQKLHNPNVHYTPIFPFEPHYSKDKVIFYYVKLIPEGFVITSADTTLEPILGFSFSKNSNFEKKSNFMLELITNALSYKTSKIEFLNKNKKFKKTVRQNKNESRWAFFLQASESLDGGSSIEQINDIKIQPFVNSKWNQTVDSGSACYNWHTPTSATEWIAGNPRNYPCGCTITAGAQVIRYFEYPQEAVGNKTFTVDVDGIIQSRSILGGNGYGDAYQWNQMVLDPNIDTPNAKRAAIGKLIHDVAIASGTKFTKKEAKTVLSNLAAAFTDTFHYDNAVFTINYNGGDLTENMASFTRILNPNLDAKLPVILALTTQNNIRHAVICDGYGYNFNVPYYHINVGWGGYGNGWYNFPEIIISSYNFDQLHSCIYNIFPEGNGEIVSGTISNSNGIPLKKVKITAVESTTGKIVETLSDDNGIYAFKKLHSDSTFTIFCGNSAKLTVKTGKSGRFGNNADEVGNLWGINLQTDTYSLKGKIKGISLNEIKLTITGNAEKTAICKPNGEFEFPNLPNGTYTIYPSKPGYNISPKKVTFSITDKSINIPSFNITTENVKITENSIITLNLDAIDNINIKTLDKFKIYLQVNNKKRFLKIINYNKTSGLLKVFFNKNLKTSIWKECNKLSLSQLKQQVKSNIPTKSSLHILIKKGKELKLIDTTIQPPKMISLLDSTLFPTNTLNSQSEFYIKGLFFGKKLKASLINLKSEKIYKLKILKFFQYRNYKNKPSIMNQETGESIIKLEINKKIPPGNYYIMLLNKTGGLGTITNNNINKLYEITILK